MSVPPEHEHDNDHDREACVRLAERLSEYLDGELPSDLVDEVETHFEGCSRCEIFLDSLRRVKRLGSLLPEVEIPPEDLERIRADVRSRLRRA
jgi:anti-sigma factor RsiW